MEQTRPFCRDTVLGDYMPLPRAVLELPLSASAKLLYGVLLDRGTLSRKNNYVNQQGQVYVIYTIEHLIQIMHKSRRRILECLKELEQAGLIRRERCGMNSPSRIFLSVPTCSFLHITGAENGTSDVQIPAPVTCGKLHPNDLRKQPDYNNLYEQYSEEESL